MSTARADKEREDLRTVLEITRSMAATVDLDALLRLIIDKGMSLLNAERATLFLHDAKRGELYSRLAAGVDGIRFSARQGVAGAAVTTGQTIRVADAYADKRFNPEIDRQTGFRTRSILAVPLRGYEGELVGVLQVLNKRRGEFDGHDVFLAETLAAQAGVIIQRAELIEHYLRKQEMERAMRMARDIQQGLLPRGTPAVCGFDLAGFCRPADETGGDTYDFMPLPGGRWMLVVADASGHGIGPALVIAETRAMLRAVSLHHADAATVLQTVNSLLTADLGEARFVTCFFGLLDPLEGTLSYASAGHGPLLFYDRRTDRVRQVAATGLPLGLMEDADYSSVEHHPFQPGDLAVITTDGFFEAVNPSDEPFGVERMIDLLRRDRDQPAKRILQNLHEEVDRFTQGRPQADDLTAVVLRRR